MIKKVVYSRYGEPRHIYIIDDSTIKIAAHDRGMEIVGIENLDTDQCSMIMFGGGPSILHNSIFSFSGSKFYVEKITNDNNAAIRDNMSFTMHGRFIKKNLTYKDGQNKNYRRNRY